MTVERKTFSSTSQPRAESMIVKNPFYDYSSYTYNFTLAAVRKTSVNEPDSYINKELDLVILKTGGKGTVGLSEKVTPITRTVSARTEGDTRDFTTLKEDFSGEELVRQFNVRSPGRFDMYIENIEIDTIMGPNEQSGATTATAIKFDVIEPYSINGFIEALHVSAVAAGYLNYTQASYVLKMEFKGYPSGIELPSPEVISDSTRYFLFGFTGVDVEVTEKGTRYRCKAVPFNEKVLGVPNIIKSPVSMSGNTVKKILTNFFDNLNGLISDDDSSSKSDNKVASKSDQYFIKFPVRNADGSFNFDKDNEIAETKLVEIDRTNRLFKFTDPGNASKGNAYRIVGEKATGKESPEVSEMQVQFREKARIHEIITSIIRDSAYVKDKLKELDKNLDDYGYLDYFIIKTEVSNQKEIDTVTRKPFQNFTYVVLPYKVHYTRVPGYASQKIDTSKFKNIVLKEYNYIYTGKNNDILNFKINFNTLFFEAIPRALGDNDQPSSRFSSSERDKYDQTIKGDDQSTIKKEIVGIPMLRVSDTPTSVQQIGGNAAQPTDDPYQALARNMHEAIINSQASMISGDIEILGDPFYLIQAGIGNFNPKFSSKSDRMNELGDANHLLGEVLIQINFKNPVGIQSLEEGGLNVFDSESVPFGGIYRVNKVQNYFSDGIFKQRLQIIRLAGQILDNSEETDPNDKFLQKLVKEEGVEYTPLSEEERINFAASFPEGSAL